MSCASLPPSGPDPAGDHIPSPRCRRRGSALLFRQGCQSQGCGDMTQLAATSIQGSCIDLPRPPRRVEWFCWCMGIDCAILRIHESSNDWTGQQTRPESHYKFSSNWPLGRPSPGPSLVEATSKEGPSRASAIGQLLSHGWSIAPHEPWSGRSAAPAELTVLGTSR